MNSIPEMKPFCVNIILYSPNSAEYNCPMTTINCEERMNLTVWWDHNGAASAVQLYRTGRCGTGIQCIEQEFINVFSRRTTVFHRRAKVKTFRVEILDSRTVLAQSSSQLVNLQSAQPLINETLVMEQSILYTVTPGILYVNSLLKMFLRSRLY